MKKTMNIVFYKFNGEDNNKVQACLFYNDGTVKNVSYDEALKEAKEIAKEEKTLGTSNFKDLLNTKRVFVMSGEELTRKFQSFVVDDTVKNAIDEALDNIDLEDNKVLTKTRKVTNNNLIVYDEKKNSLLNNTKKEVIKDEIVTENEEDKDLNNGYVMPISTKEDINDEEDLVDEDIDDEKINEIVEEASEFDKEDEEMDNRLNAEVADESKPLEEVKEEKEDIFTKIKKTVKGKVVPLAITAALVAGGAGVASAYSLSHAQKSGAMTKTNIETEVEVADNGNGDEVIVNYANQGNNTIDNSKYKNYTYKKLLEVTTNQKQKEVMQNMSVALDYFNGDFADAYIEEDVDVRAALSWDEMMALQMAYNDYSKEDIHAIINGAEISSNELENAYKNATLQLMGAYVIENENSLLDVTKFVHDQEGIKFVQKYQRLLEKAKNTKGDEQLRAVEAFYSELYKDFPITEKVRTEGLSHADNRNIESYKLAVAPMVGAAEMMFQNLKVDHTLTDKAIAYFNDLGLCNYAQDKFDRIEMISLACCQDDKENPLYYQFRYTKINELVKTGIYVIDDEHRDLSRLNRFQKLVNGHFKMINGHFCLKTWYTTERYTIKKKWKETHVKRWTKTTRTETSDRNKAVKEAGEKKVKEAEDKVNRKIEEENRRAREEAERAARERQEEMQREADKQKEELEDKVKEDEQDLEDKIDDANDNINDGETVNEDDFGDHNVDFDKEHSDDNGNLNDSVKDITEDGSDADKELEDPNKTGEEFDKNAPEYDGSNTYDEETDSQIDYSDTDSNNNNNDLGDPNDTGKSFDNNSNDDDNDYEIEYDNEIDDSEDEKSTKKTETKSESKETKKEEVKEVKKESAPAQQQEVKKEAPKEVKKEAPKEVKKEEPKEEKHDDDSNEARVDKYVEKLAAAKTKDSEKTLVLS